MGGQLASDETNQQQNQKLPQQHAPRKKLGEEGITIAFGVKGVIISMKRPEFKSTQSKDKRTSKMQSTKLLS